MNKTTEKTSRTAHGARGAQSDRKVNALLRALRARGFPAKRADAIEIASALSGYRNSNAYLAARAKTANDGGTRTTVHVALLEHRYGSDLYAALDRPGLDRQIATYCRSSWDEADQGRPEAGLDDDAVIEAYYERIGDDESMRTETIDVDPVGIDTGLDARERNAVLAGLRCLQTAMATPGILDPCLRDILENDGAGLGADELDALCERFNR